MSTRATYSFQSHNYPSVTLYIHHDGYPSGAAAYFWNALHCENRRGGLACMMIRANEGAEITSSHDDHGDTEYRYDVSGNGPAAEVRVEQREFADAGTDHWVLYYAGQLKDFIAENTELIGDDFSPFVPVQVARYAAQQWWTPKTAKAEIARQLSLIAVCRGNLENINVTNALEAIAKLQPVTKQLHADLTYA